MISCHENHQLDVQVKNLFSYKSNKIEFDAEILCLHHKGICLIEMHFCSVGKTENEGICYGLNLLPVQIFLNWFIFFKPVHIFQTG